ncbi:MAG: SLC13 family permease [Candidatus Heimdallarchaeota archaeon]|nr:SLC13 family permease [Candidatus Heimdallarchaeota archaeon]
MAVELNGLHVFIITSIFILTYVGIIHPKIDKTIAAVFGAVVGTICIIKFKLPDPHNNDHFLTEEGLLHFQDLQIIGLIFGTLIIVEISQESGVFHFLSIKILKLSKGDPKLLLRYFGALTLFLSALVNNISAMMIVGTLTIIACERLELDPKPYIIVELSMTTVGGIATLISSVPNIIISQQFGISFGEFLMIGLIWSIVCMILNFIVFEYIFRNQIQKVTDPEKMKARVDVFDEWSAIKDRKLFNRSIIVLALTIIAFVFSTSLGLSLAVIAIFGGITSVIVSGKKLEEVMAKLDWGLIAFFLGLFVLIATLDAVQILDYIAEVLSNILPNNQILAIFILLWFVAITSGIVDNIVVAAAFSPILLRVALASPTLSPTLIAWSLIFGANFGGGFTPIGAPSGVVGIALLYKKTGKKIGWGEFIKTQGLATLVKLLFTMGYLFILSYFL